MKKIIKNYHKQKKISTVFDNLIKRLKNLKENLQKNSKILYMDEDRISKINVDSIRKEICLWRNRCYELKDNYIKCLKEMKDELFKDRTLFQEDFAKMHKNFNKNISDTQKRYLIQINKNEKNIEILKREFMELTKKEAKVKEVFHYNYDI